MTKAFRDAKPEPRTPEASSLVSATVALAASEQAGKNVANPWILLKIKALGELLPEAGLKLEYELDQGRTPRQIAVLLLQDHRVRLSELEVARYGAWLPHLRRDADRKAQEQSERNVQEVRQRTKRARP